MQSAKKWLFLFLLSVAMAIPATAQHTDPLLMDSATMAAIGKKFHAQKYSRKIPKTKVSKEKKAKAAPVRPVVQAPAPAAKAVTKAVPKKKAEKAVESTPVRQLPPAEPVRPVVKQEQQQQGYVMTRENEGGIRGSTLALRTNFLYDLAANPNVGLEVQFPNGVAVIGEWIGAWWIKDRTHHYFADYAAQLEVRTYLTSRRQVSPFYGHHIGIYGQVATFDFEFGGTGYQSPKLDMSWGMGLSYGYSMPLSRSFNLDFTVGLGYFRSEYYKYEPYDRYYIKRDTKDLHWFGPTKLEISLQWMLNKKNVWKVK